MSYPYRRKKYKYNKYKKNYDPYRYEHSQMLRESKHLFFYFHDISIFFNHYKSRYKNSVHSITTMVKIPSIDFINAHYISGIHSKGDKFYIATQAPLEHTIDDFWKMVYEKKVKIIVMLTGIVEYNIEKAIRYWPSSKNDPLIINDNFKIILKGTKHFPGFKESSLEIIKNDNDPFELKHYYYEDWKDATIPSSMNKFLNFMNYLNDDQYDLFNETDHVIVHCSAGVGRTAVFICVDTIIKKIKEDEEFDFENYSIYELAKRIRSERSLYSFRIYDQYKFCYDSLFKYVKKYNNIDNKSLKKI